MNPVEASDLLTHCATFDNRKASAAAAVQWAKSLEDVPYDQDAKDAVARFYGTPPERPGDRLWIQPHDVRTHRQAIRRERLENFTYEPLPDEDAATYLARYRLQLAAVASGAIAAPSDAPQLKGNPHPSVAGVLEGAGWTVPGEVKPLSVKRPGPLGVECPQCKAPIGHQCHSPQRRKPRPPHTDRRHLATGATSTRESADEIARRRAVYAAQLAQMTDTEATA